MYGSAAAEPFSLPIFRPRLNAFRASSEEVVACWSGTSYFWTVAIDSPSCSRSFAVAPPSDSRTFSFEAAVACCCARTSPVWQFTAFRDSTYSLPRLLMEPEINALPLARWQSSLATSGVSGVPLGRDISFSVAAILLSASTLRYGDWARATLRAVFNVSSKTGSPVEFAKSATTIVSRSDSAGEVLRLLNHQKAPAAMATITIAAIPSHSRELVPAAVTPEPLGA